MKTFKMRFLRIQCIGLLSAMFFFSWNSFAQQSKIGVPGNHPRIYVNSANEDLLMQSLEKVEWKNAIIQKKKEHIEKYIELCDDDPEWLVSRLQMNWKTKHNKVFLRGGNFSYSEGEAPVPTVRFSGTRDWATNYRSLPLEEMEPYFDDERGLYLKNKTTGEMEWVHPSKSGHTIEGINAKIMALAEDAAFLFWFTGDQKYAEFAAPVFDTYMKGMYYREAPVDLNNSNQQRISGLQTFEVIHEKIVMSLALIYDFMFDYLTQNGHDMDLSAAVFQKWGDQIIKNGVPDNNWNFFQARFLTYIALALDNNDYYENGKGQQYYLDRTFNITTERQIALKEAIRNYDQENGIWPECASYSMHVTETLLKILTLLDNATNANEFENFPIVEKATLASFQYLFPNGNIVAFGDSRHQTLPAESFEYLIANYRKYGKAEKEKQITALYNTSFSKHSKSSRGKGLFELFFYVDELEGTKSSNANELLTDLTSPTFYAPNVSWFVQRMGTGDNATMVSTAGALGNHAHANGIAIELYANNCVLAPEMGKGPSYWHEDHRNYYSRYPAHNTVVVNGISDAQSMRASHPFKLENHFPKSGDRNNIFTQVTFSNVFFVEPKTLANQQRLTAIVNSKSGKGYVLDLFRSAIIGEKDQQHDYFLHNLAQSLTFTGVEDQQLLMKSSGKLKSKGYLKAYNYFTEEQSLTYSNDLNAQFKLESEGNPTSIMKVWMKGGEDREYFSLKGMKSKALSKQSAPEEIIDEKLPTLVVRNKGEAWSKPFVAILNPYFEGRDELISKVSFPEIKRNDAQEIHIEHTDGKTKDVIVVASSENGVVNSDEYYQKGLLTIKRETENEFEFVFAAGLTRYVWGDWEILTNGEPVTTSIERCKKGFKIQCDKAVKIGVPSTFNPEYIEIYENGNLVEKRKGLVNRNNPEKIDFNFEKPIQEAVIVLK